MSHSRPLPMSARKGPVGSRLNLRLQKLPEPETKPARWPGSPGRGSPILLHPQPTRLFQAQLRQAPAWRQCPAASRARSKDTPVCWVQCPLFKCSSPLRRRAGKRLHSTPESQQGTFTETLRKTRVQRAGTGREPPGDRALPPCGASARVGARARARAPAPRTCNSHAGQ